MFFVPKMFYCILKRYKSTMSGSKQQTTTTTTATNIKWPFINVAFHSALKSFFTDRSEIIIFVAK